MAPFPGDPLCHIMNDWNNREMDTSATLFISYVMQAGFSQDPFYYDCIFLHNVWRSYPSTGVVEHGRKHWAA